MILILKTRKQRLNDLLRIVSERTRNKINLISNDDTVLSALGIMGDVSLGSRLDSPALDSSVWIRVSGLIALGGELFGEHLSDPEVRGGTSCCPLCWITEC